MTLTLNSLTETLLGLLFPDRCATCDRPGSLFCSDCQAGLRPYPDHKLTVEDVDGNHYLDGATVAFVFEGPLRKAVHHFKYQRVRRMAAPLGDLLTHHLCKYPMPADAIVPVPLHPKRLAERGFNQSGELARHISRTHGVPAIAGLVRKRDTEHQARLNLQERQQNVRDAFVWSGRKAPPRRVLLLDDVLTTGATVNACAQALRQAGVQEVRVLALARSRPHT